MQYDYTVSSKCVGIYLIRRNKSRENHWGIFAVIKKSHMLKQEPPGESPHAVHFWCSLPRGYSPARQPLPRQHQDSLPETQSFSCGQNWADRAGELVGPAQGVGTPWLRRHSSAMAPLPPLAEDILALYLFLQSFARNEHDVHEGFQPLPQGMGHPGLKRPRSPCPPHVPPSCATHPAQTAEGDLASPPRVKQSSSSSAQSRNYQAP